MTKRGCSFLSGIENNLSAFFYLLGFFKTIYPKIPATLAHPNES